MTTLLDGNVFGTASSLIVVEEVAERAAFDKLHPEVREILRECPYEFSAIDAQTLWKHCAGFPDSIGEFRWQLEMNVEAMRAEERRLGIGPDIKTLPQLRRYVAKPQDDIDPNDPEVFSLY